MTDEEYKSIIIDIAKSFNALPSNRDRIEIIKNLLRIIEEKAPSKLIKDWINQAKRCLGGCLIIWDIKD